MAQKIKNWFVAMHCGLEISQPAVHNRILRDFYTIPSLEAHDLYCFMDLLRFSPNVIRDGFTKIEFEIDSARVVLRSMRSFAKTCDTFSWSRQHWIFTQKTVNNPSSVYKPLTRGALWNYWHFPSRTKAKDFFNNLGFKVFTVGVQSFFRPFEPRPEERKQLNFREEPQRRPSSMINFPSSQNCQISACFFSILRTGEDSRWIDD